MHASLLEQGGFRDWVDEAVPDNEHVCLRLYSTCVYCYHMFIWMEYIVIVAIVIFGIDMHMNEHLMTTEPSNKPRHNSW